MDEAKAFEQALKAFCAAPEFGVLAEWVRRKIDALHKRLERETNLDTLRDLQGQVRILRQIENLPASVLGPSPEGEEEMTEV